MRNPQLMRAFREGRKVSCNPAQQGVEFKLCRSQQFALRNYLMISFVSSHGHRGLLATEERRRRLAEAGVRRKPRLKQSRRGAFVGKVKDVDGCELKRMKLGIRAWCEFQGRPWRVRRSGGPYSRGVASFPQNPLGFGHPVPVFSRCARQSSRQVGRELLRRPYGPRLEIIPPPV
jgi:hypothetical protein